MINAPETDRNSETQPPQNEVAYQLATQVLDRWAAFHEGTQMAACQHAWDLADAAGYDIPADSECRDVLRLAWTVPRCRLWMQEQQARWPRERRETWAAFMEAGASGEARAVSPGRRLSAYTAKRPQWLLEPWLRQGKLHTLEGKKGVGKSQLVLWLAGQIFKRTRTGTVAIYTREDEIEQDIMPRAMALGVDMDRLIVYDDRVSFADGDLISGRIEADSSRLVVFDTLQKYIPKRDADMNSAFGAQSQIDPLEGIIQRTGCAALVVRHTRKGAVGEASEAGLGSQGIAGAARAILTAGRHPKNEGEFALSLAVGNQARAGEGTVAYQLKVARVPVSDGVAETTFVDVLRDEPDLNADDITGAERSTGGEGGQLGAAKEFLRSALADGRVPIKELLRAAAADSGISSRTLHRAGEAVGVLRRRQEQPGQLRQYWPTTWELPRLDTPNKSGNPDTHGKPLVTPVTPGTPSVGAESIVDNSQGCQTRQACQAVRARAKTSQSDTQPSPSTKGDEMGKQAPTDVCYHEAKIQLSGGGRPIWYCTGCGKVRNDGASHWREHPGYDTDWEKYDGADAFRYHLLRCVETAAERDGIAPGSPEFLERVSAMRDALGGTLVMRNATIVPHTADAAVG